MPGAAYRALSADELSVFCAQLAMILKSGIPVAEGLSIMHGDMQKTAGEAILADLNARVQAGGPLHEALDGAGCFPKYMVDMVQIGSETGRLDEVMEQLSIYYEREEQIAKSVKSAVAYPLVMIVMMILVIGVLIVRVLPIFAQVFAQLGAEMSAFSVGVMNFGAASAGVCAVITAVAAVLVLAGFVASRNTGRTGRARTLWGVVFCHARAERQNRVGALCVRDGADACERP
jgi:type IV pilus assembly protein PilC